MSKTRLFEAIKNLDLEQTRRILDAKPELLHIWNEQGRNLLHLACSAEVKRAKKTEASAARMVGYFLDRGLDIEEEGGSGSDLCKPIWFATARGRNLTVVKLLLKRGAKPTGLYAAGWWEDIAILNALIDAGANIEKVVGVTPFLACWGWKRFKAAKALALKDANVNVQDKRGRTALHIGIEKEFDPALLKWLVKHGASPDIPNLQGITARQLAARKRKKEFAAALGSAPEEAYDRRMDEELVTVRNCNWLHEAEFVKSVLDADGIDAQIPDEYIAGVQPCYGAAIGGVRVQVRSSDLERAEQSLAATIPVE